MADDDIGSVGFLYRAMVERDPGKRRVKPVEKHLQLLDFGDLDDSSDDSDFKIGDEEQGTDESDNDSGDTTENSDDSDEQKDKDDEDKDEEEKVTTKAETPQGDSKLSVGDLIERAMQRQSQARQRIAVDGTPSRRLKVVICSVCLGDISEEEDEIVECDCCGVSVHEGCYGISDTDTVVSTVSSSSTEPWFCDACKAGNTNPVCELCPNPGGIFKETDVGRWVHLVCALYIPGVAFGDVDKLTPVTLFEMPYNKWGAKACSLCEDDRFSRTGVCISCDAGMCRNYFHVTCALREGLLSEASTEEDIADPFFAYCKLHADKNIVRFKRRNWLALQSQAKERKLTEKPASDEKTRIERKLAWHREKYVNTKASRPPPWVPTQKMPRLLSSSPSACRKLLKKAELLGITPQTHVSNAESVLNIRRKWHVPAGFTVEFISYYLDRNSRMITMQRRLDELLLQNSQYQEQEHSLREKYDQLVNEVEELKKQNNALQEKGLEFWKILCEIGNKKFPLPEVLKPKCVVKSPSSRTNKRSDSSSSTVIFECGICHKSHDQHLLAKCDSCQLHYHLGCLDPPLTRMPKKTKSQGWQCSECDKTEEEERGETMDPNAPRKLRFQIKEPAKFMSLPRITRRYSLPKQQEVRASRRLKKESKEEESPVQSVEEESKSSNATDVERKPEDNSSEVEKQKEPEREPVVVVIQKTSKQKRKRRGRKGLRRMLEAHAESLDVESHPVEPQPKIPRLTVSRRGTELHADCVRCKEQGDNTNLVRFFQRFHRFEVLKGAQNEHCLQHSAPKPLENLCAAQSILLESLLKHLVEHDTSKRNTTQLSNINLQTDIVWAVVL